MTTLAAILADSDDFGKVIAAIVVFVIWGLGAMANLSKKQNQKAQQRQVELDRQIRAQVEEARRREAAAEALAQVTRNRPADRPGPRVPPPPMSQQIPTSMARHGPVVPPMRQVRVPAPAVPPPRPVRQQQQQQPKKPKKRPTPPPVPAAAQAVEPLVDTPGVLESEIGQGSAPASPTRRQAAAAPMVRLTPESLRQQFILTEILQPPLALRDDRPAGA